MSWTPKMSIFSWHVSYGDYCLKHISISSMQTDSKLLQVWVPSPPKNRDDTFHDQHCTALISSVHDFSNITVLETSSLHFLIIPLVGYMTMLYCTLKRYRISYGISKQNKIHLEIYSLHFLRISTLSWHIEQMRAEFRCLFAAMDLQCNSDAGTLLALWEPKG